MPYVCSVTGEISIDGLPGAEVHVETGKNLVSEVVVTAPSEVTHKTQRWVWKEEHELTPDEHARYVQLKRQHGGETTHTK
jgi:hypothetical protein